MEFILIITLFVFALMTIAIRVRKLFNSECGECSGDCSCCQSNLPEYHQIIKDVSKEVRHDEKP